MTDEFRQIGVIPRREYRQGQRTITCEVPAGTRRVKVELASCTSDDPTIWADRENRVGVVLEASFAGDPRWHTIGGFEAYGGINRHFVTQQEHRSSWLVAPWPFPDRDGFVRVVFTRVTHATVLTSGAISIATTAPPSMLRLRRRT